MFNSFGSLILCHLILLHPFRSLFCLSPAGDTPSSARLFDAIVSGCIPVIVSDELELPFEGILDYRKVCRIYVFIFSVMEIHKLCELTAQLVKLYDHH